MSRIEAVMSAVNAALEGLSTTQFNVTRKRGNKWPEGTLACLEIEQGALVAVDGESVSIREVGLSFTVVINCKVNPLHETPETALNTIASEVYEALMSNSQKLGLDYVGFVEWLGDEPPDVDSAEFKHGRMESEYRVQFYHRYESRGA